MFYLLLMYLSSFLSHGLSWPQRQEEVCQSGFGALANFCGEYTGLVTKELDRQEKCFLLQGREVTLTVLPTREVRINLGEDYQFHSVGKISKNNRSLDVDLLRKDCSPLEGIKKKSSSCKRLNLEGSFFNSGGMQGFNGEYKIFDEGSFNYCRYSLYLSRKNELSSRQ